MMASGFYGSKQSSNFVWYSQVWDYGDILLLKDAPISEKEMMHNTMFDKP